MHSKVTINGEVRGQIGKGFMVLIGVGEEDTVEIADKMIHKMVNMRIFEDENGKTNLGLKEVGGSLLLISQFTLYADCKRGNRPSFIRAGAKVCLTVFIFENTHINHFMDHFICDFNGIFFSYSDKNHKACALLIPVYYKMMKGNCAALLRTE